MQIKKFLAPTLREAMEQMKTELGLEAVVLSTRVLEGDVRLGQKKMFEITSGVEDDYDLLKNINEKKEAILAQKAKDKPAEKKSFESELKKMTEKIYGKADEYKSTTEEFSTSRKAVSGDFDDIARLLEQRDVDKNIINQIISQMSKYSAILNPGNMESYIISTIASMIPTSKFEYKKKDGPVIVSMVGPTGVGKTTCIAKLAVISKILHNLDIGLISIDTYRLGAIDQLKTFAEVSNTDFLVAYDPADLARAVAKFKKKDIVFIDTVGRSQNNKTLLESMNKFLSVVKIDETYLVLNSSSTSKTMADAAKKFEVLGYDSFVFTKIDEAASHGNLLNLLHRFNKPVKYLTNGQVIPDDIIAADPEFIANLIYSGNVNQ